MKHIGHFIISPRSTLLDRLANLDPTDSLGLAPSVIWTADEYDRGSLLRTDVDLLTKLLFLDMLHRERSMEKQFPSIFPDFILKDSYFDSLWLLQRIRLDMSMEDAIDEAIEAKTLDSLLGRGNERIDEVIKLTLQRKQKRASQ